MRSSFVVRSLQLGPTHRVAWAWLFLLFASCIPSPSVQARAVEQYKREVRQTDTVVLGIMAPMVLGGRRYLRPRSGTPNPTPPPPPPPSGMYEAPGERGGFAIQLPTSSEGTITYNPATGDFDNTVMTTTYALPSGSVFTLVDSGSAATNATNLNTAIASGLAVRNAIVVLPVGVFNVAGSGIDVNAGSVGGTNWVYVMSAPMHAGTNSLLSGTRVDPAIHGADLTTINYTGSRNTGWLRTLESTDASYIRFVGIVLTAPTLSAQWSDQTDMVRLSEAQTTTAATRPHHIIFDRCCLKGLATDKVRNGMLVGANYVAWLDSLITEIHNANISEPHGVSIHNCNGPFKWINSALLEVRGIGYFTGGEGSDSHVTRTLVGASVSVGAETEFSTGAVVHWLRVGQTVLIAGHDGGTGVLDGPGRVITSLPSTTTFRVGIDTSLGGTGSGGTVYHMSFDPVTGAALMRDPTACPHDHEIRGMVIQNLSFPAGQSHKNCLEFKYSHRHLVIDSMFDGSITRGQKGQACLFQTSISAVHGYHDLSRTPTEKAEFSVRHVVFWYNTIKNCAFGFALTGITTSGSTDPTTGTVYHNSLAVNHLAGYYSICHNFVELGTGVATGDGSRKHAILQSALGPCEMIHNTFSCVMPNALSNFPVEGNPGQGLPGQACDAFYYEDNIAGDTGNVFMKGSGKTQGTATLNAFCTVWRVRNNVFWGDLSQLPSTHPGGNVYLADPESNVGYTNLGGRDYTLPGASPYAGTAFDGTDPGVDWARHTVGV